MVILVVRAAPLHPPQAPQSELHWPPLRSGESWPECSGPFGHPQPSLQWDSRGRSLVLRAEKEEDLGLGEETPDSSLDFSLLSVTG